MFTATNIREWRRGKTAICVFSYSERYKRKKNTRWTRKRRRWSAKKYHENNRRERINTCYYYYFWNWLKRISSNSLSIQVIGWTLSYLEEMNKQFISVLSMWSICRIRSHYTVSRNINKYVVIITNFRNLNIRLNILLIRIDSVKLTSDIW